MFRILIVDDNPAIGQLLRELMKNLRRPPELSCVTDGLEALDFLRGRGAHANTPLPHLVLLDMNMPRMNGLETLSAIKADPELRVIPVLMFSAISSPEDVRKSYQAYASCFLQKPADLRRAIEFVHAVEAFWMDFALLPGRDQPAPGGPDPEDSDPTEPAAHSRSRAGDHSGSLIARGPTEARSRASEASAKKTPSAPARHSDCEEHNHLLGEFGRAVHEVLQLHEQQYLAIVEGDRESERFDLLIHMAGEKKQSAKYNYLQHVANHGCPNSDASE